MPTIEVSLPDRIDTEIERLVHQGEFLNRDQAVEELLTMGISAYDVGDPGGEEPAGEWVTQTVEDQQDPASQHDSGDEPRF